MSRRPDFLAKAESAQPLGQAAQALSGIDPGDPANYNPGGTGDCGFKTGSNVKVNQDCLNLTDWDLQGRGQAQNETSIAQDPNAPKHLVAAFNDYRRGDEQLRGRLECERGPDLERADRVVRPSVST